MTRVQLDANIFLHALGNHPRLRPACERVIQHVANGDLVGEASALLVDEVVHVRHRRSGDRLLAVEDGRAVRALLVLQPVTDLEIDAAMEIFAAHPGLQFRDAIHVASARRNGVDRMFSTDLGFDGVPGLTRIDPTDVTAIDALLGR